MTEIFYADDWITVYQGDALEVLRTLPDESCHMCMTSPPFFGLRDYGTGTWGGGDAECDHTMPATGSTQNKGNNGKAAQPFKDTCGKCGARRIDRQIGIEPTPEDHIAALVAVFREVRRVLRSDGTLWLEYGDSYMSGQGGRQTAAGEMPLSGKRTDSEPWNGQKGLTSKVLTTRDGIYKPKDLMGMPWRVAFALQADGWYLRSDIIWSRPNPMPESVTDRPTKSHSYVFLLAKSPRYFFDQEAVRENGAEPERQRADRIGGANGHKVHHSEGAVMGTSATRNIRSVWTIPTASYPGAHFATFPPKLVLPCIKAGTSERGCCPECGAPWVREVTRGRVLDHETCRDGKTMSGPYAKQAAIRNGILPTSITTGWHPSCAHGGEPVPCVVLDPFAGTGTVGMVAQSLSRRAVLIDLNADYLAQCLERNAQSPLGL